MLKAYYDPVCNNSWINFDSTRKHAMIAEKLQLIPYIQVRKPECNPLPYLQRVHAANYLHAIEYGKQPLAHSPNLEWEPNTYLRALAAVSAIQAASLEALSSGTCVGAVCSGFHHACFEHGGGFCTFNGLLVAALAIQELRPDASILILDFDFHFGNGTCDIIERLDLKNITNVTAFGRWYGNLPNHPGIVPIQYNSPDRYKAIISAQTGLIEEKKWNFVIYQAGMDPHEGSVDGMPGITTEILEWRDNLVFSACKRAKVPVSFCMAGGYKSDRLTAEQLADLHIGTFRHAASVFC